MSLLWQNTRYGLRMLRKSPGFTAVAVVSLALGIGANTAIFSLVDKLLLRTLPVKAPEQLMLLSSESISPHFINNIFSYPDYADYRDQNQVCSGLIAFNQTSLNLGSDEQAAKVTGEYVSGNYFDVLGVQTVRGRASTPEEERAPDAQPVAIVSYGLWQRRFSADPDLVGKAVTLNGVSCTVIGIAPGEFTGMTLERPTDIWVPLLLRPQLTPGFAGLTKRNGAWLKIMGRLRPGVTSEQARAGLDVLATQIRGTYLSESERHLPFNERRMLLESGGKGISILRQEFSRPLLLLMAVVGLILLIACTNVANLLLARSTVRRKEMAVRLALGAGRARLINQLLTESVLLALIGGATGLLLAPWLTEALLAFHPRLATAPDTLRQVLDMRVFGFTLLVALLSGLIFGLVPALQSAQADLTLALKDEGSMLGRGPRRLSPRNLLVIAQVALSLVVLVGAGLFVKSLRQLFAIDPGFKPANVLIVPLDLTEKKFDERSGPAFYRQITERLKALPGVAEVSAASVIPMSGSVMTNSVIVEGYETKPGENIGIDANTVGPDYHRLMGIPLVRGRDFTAQDRADAPGVCIINEAMARLYFPAQDPIGKWLKLGDASPQLEIVGVARDSKYHELTEAAQPHLDLPLLQQASFRFLNLHLRATSDAASLLPVVRREIKGLDPHLSLLDMRTMAGWLSDSIAAARMAATLVGLFGLIALLLAAIGLYGVLSYSVNRRRREIGIRLALGARTGDVLRLVLREGMTLVFIGTGLGLGGAFVSTRLFASLLYGVSATDPLTFVGVSLLLVLIALLACYLPARRATKVDPMSALRYE